ncbi:hypothetical protein BH18ACT4_BH18ACT4_06280 [soil metagenome]
MFVCLFVRRVGAAAGEATADGMEDDRDDERKGHGEEAPTPLNHPDAVLPEVEGVDGDGLAPELGARRPCWPSPDVAQLAFEIVDLVP